jgi:hypothetical protein
MSERLVEFQHQQVTFIRTDQIKNGVECDVYDFKDDSSKDLAIVRVKANHSTPLQKVLAGDSTFEGYLSGEGQLVVGDTEGHTTVYGYSEDGQATNPVNVSLGQTMQWHAGTKELVFYEICTPPYEDGRFENVGGIE